MRTLLIAAAALAFTVNVNAQEQTGGEGTIGGVAIETIAAGAVGVAVAAAIISNTRGTTVNPGTGPVNPTDPTCNAGDGAPVNGVCTGTTVTGTATGTATGTGTSTVTFTYAPTVK